MNRWYKLSQSAAKAALKYRRQVRLSLDAPCDIYETIRNHNIELQFVDIPSLEGMYLEEPEVTRICVTAYRPWGRQRFTAAHELGHHILRHGTQVEAAIESRYEEKGISNEEILADGFARFLLMPPRAVTRAFAESRFDPLSVYKASCWLGVGYESLVRQLSETLKLISEDVKKELLKVSRQELCQKMLRDPGFKGDLWLLDPTWTGRTIHAQVGDALLGVSNENNPMLSPVANGTKLIQAVGETCLNLAKGGQALLRAARRNFIGFYDYRYLAE